MPVMSPVPLEAVPATRHAGGVPGVLADEERLAAVRKQYGVTAERKVHGTSYDVAHSSSTYLVDRAGRLRALMTYGHGPDDYVHDLAILLQDPAGDVAH